MMFTEKFLLRFSEELLIGKIFQQQSWEERTGGGRLLAVSIVGIVYQEFGFSICT